MILTLTPNPSVDRTISVASLARGAVQRATDTRMDPGGKGINVSRALALNGATTRAILPVGGGHGRMMLELLQDAATPVITVPIRGAIRANVAIVEPDGTTTKVNELGPVLDEAEVAVSYTHLDVYKRQGRGGAGPPRRSSPSRAPRTGRTGRGLSLIHI